MVGTLLQEETLLVEHLQNTTLWEASIDKLAYREKRAWVLEDIHFIISAFPALVVKFISARFPTVQTITGTRLHVLSLTDVLCVDVGTLQVISL